MSQCLLTENLPKFPVKIEIYLQNFIFMLNHKKNFRQWKVKSQLLYPLLLWFHTIQKVHLTLPNNSLFGFRKNKFHQIMYIKFGLVDDPPKFLPYPIIPGFFRTFVPSHFLPVGHNSRLADDIQIWFKFGMEVASHNRSKKIYSITNGCHGYVVTSLQSAKKKEKICKNLYNFEELSLLYKTYGLRGNSPYNYT